jgi:glycosyltransferase involved in cell wall biosynthesis
MIKVIFEGSIFFHQKKEGISKFIQKKLSEKGYKRIKKFSWDKCTSKIVKIYRQIASKI